MLSADTSCTASFFAIACLDLRIALVEARGWLRRHGMVLDWA